MLTGYAPLVPWRDVVLVQERLGGRGGQVVFGVLALASLSWRCHGSNSFFVADLPLANWLNRK